ncbi:hypothetical protein HPB48_015930 [Haemaphysalis longicornis]|uniref:Uncharacterized protein n=1 Tax=Haemaphysalis longicornis TaxID=44386 RepID=A0A9J6GYQ0_HAELO|nr:hypothetical protein HPB48_015930 [Haemaphysalis longicornis]
MMLASQEFGPPMLATNGSHCWSIRATITRVQKRGWKAIIPGDPEEMIDRGKRPDNQALTFLFLVVKDNHLHHVDGRKTAR